MWRHELRRPSGRSVQRLVQQALAIAALGVAGASVPAAEVLEGQVAWCQVSDLGLPVGGRIAEITVRAGETVPAGSVLARLESAPFQIRVRHAEARVAALTPQVEDARREAERAQSLYDRTVLSEVELRQAEFRRDALEGRRRSAEVALAEARLRQTYRQLEAPFAGRVLRVYRQTGEVVAPRARRDPLVRLAATEGRCIIVPLTAAERGAWSLGRRARVIRSADEWSGAVRGIVDRGAESEAPRYRLRIHLDTGALIPGQTVEVRSP